jgi:CHAT domain-containing protein/tetratricopeptide (TPR) repeat protein
MSWHRVLVPLVLLARLLAPVPARAGVVLEQAENVPGLAVGTVVFGWERRDGPGTVVERGTIPDPFALLAVLRDRLPRGGFHLLAAGQPVPVPAYGAALRAEPVLPEADVARYREALRLLAGATDEEKRAGRDGLAALAAAAVEPAAGAWLRYRLALAREEANDLAGAGAPLAEAMALPGLAPLAEALLRSHLSQSLVEVQQPVQALPEAERAEAALDAAGDWPVLGALLRAETATALRAAGRLQEAEAGYAAALASLTRLAPESHALGLVLQEAGTSAWLADDLDLAMRRDRGALELFEKVGAPTAGALNALATDAQVLGRLDEAEPLYLRALAAATSDRRRALYRRNLAVLYRRRGELERSGELLRELLAFYGAAPDPRDLLDLAGTLRVLAAVERQQGDFRAAADHAQRAVEIIVERKPGSIAAADTLEELGLVRRDAGNLEGAAEAFTRALEVADALAGLGSVALARGDLDAAGAHYQGALERVRAIVPGHRLEAEALHALGRIESARGRPQAALARYRDALAIVEAMRGRLGGAHDARAGFTSLYHELYWAPLDALAAAGQASEAFALLERYRAQSLLGSMAERQLDFSADLPEPLERERRLLGVRHDSLLGKLGAAPAEKRAGLREELLRLRRQQRELEDRIHAAAPRLAALQYPRTIDASGAAALLPPGAALLSYAVGPERSWVFAVGPGERPLRAVALPAGGDRLRRLLAGYRELVTTPGARSARLELAGAELAAALLEPVAERVRAADHLIVVADGPLHLLPWAALPDPLAPDEPLIARRAVSLAASVTVLRELRARPAAAAKALVAFGDPLVPAAAAASGAALPGPVLRAGSQIGPLAWSREEALAVGALFGAEGAVFLGAEATEARLLEQAPTARRLHLACHALVDAALPLESSLVLSPPGAGAAAGENGLLQVWEIYQRLRLDADLVTLSACDTALGRELAGEGVLGLTRAFHYAGARTVVSSLWRVSDRSTAGLMRAFYRHLVDGASKAEALRRAQLEVRRGAGRHPFYWAAFQVHGSWD